MATFGGESDSRSERVLASIGLVALAALFGQHPLPDGAVFGNACQACVKAIACSTGRRPVSTFRGGIPGDRLTKRFIPLTAFFRELARPRRAAGLDACQAGLQRVLGLRRGFHGSAR